MPGSATSLCGRAGRPSAREFLRAIVWRRSGLASHRIASPEHDKKQCKTPHAQRAEPWIPPAVRPALHPPSLSPDTDEPPRRAPLGTRMNGMGFG